MRKNNTPLAAFARKVQRFQREAHVIFGSHEDSPSRRYSLDPSYAKLGTLSLRQDELLRQSLRCVESQLFRAAHVMAWVALMDFLEELLEARGLRKLESIRPKWNVASLEELRESVPESQLINAARDMKIITKNQAKALQGLLNKRNECAHPTDFYPDFNQTLGYIAEVMQRIELFKRRATGP